MNTPNEKGELLRENLKMVSGSFYIPKDNYLKPKGEDAHFICAREQTVGFADGVGSWAHKGVDAGEYARELMMNSVIALHDEPKGAVDPKRVLSQAYSNTTVQGSSTACIISFSGNVLRAVNVGDSGFMVIRNGLILYRSPVQQHRFNHPYQLGLSKDRPSSAQEIQVQVSAGDVIVAGTDGLFDNVHSFDILNLVSTGRNRGLEPEGIACTIADVALYNSFDKSIDSPFAEAARLCGIYRKGGKIDDITVIVAYFLPSNSV